ncbi:MULTISPECIES: SusC/RagA family TonB-linked outer membrane protein [Chitinophagaceae]|uniref:SusC/RagA family TonB-linked outer membrane protein n=1 Tax=Chitinophagaceae TaxID=563835 RepID=UPI000DEF96A2|nr:MULTISPECIES: TonB-dependent receptor [Chitinophagaceae]RPD47315.1 TonB-dependent receptor [Paracnuella aquatica]
MKRMVQCILACALLTNQPLHAAPYVPPGYVAYRTLTGVVTDATTKEPLAGASVQVKNSSVGTTTDAAGRFSLNVEGNVTLVVSYANYAVQEFPIKDQASITIQLEKNIASMNEVVVVGYGTQRRGEVTSAVSSVKAEDFTQGFARDAAQLIQGKVAGISVATPSGDPNATAQISLRGANSILGNNAPLVLIDGIPGNLNTVAPEDIESIDVLKDGSAAAIYGTRGNNGVILITTVKRKGGNRPPTLNYHGYVTVQQIARKMEFLNADDYRRLISQGVKGFNQDQDPTKPGYSNVAGSNDEYGANTDWFETITRTPISHTHNLTLQGGNGQTNYTASLNYRDWQGIFLRSDNRQIIGRLDVNHAMFDGKLKFNVNAITRSRKNFSGPSYSYAYRQALIRNPTEPVYTPEGNYFERPVYNYENPLRSIQETDGEYRANELRLNGSVTFTPIKDLNFKLLVSGNQTNGLSAYYEKWNHLASVNNNRRGYASRGSSFSRDELLEFTTDYSRSFGDHRISALGGYSYQYNSYEGFDAYNSDFPSDLFSYNRLESGDGLAFQTTPFGMNSDKNDWRLIGFFGRFNYTFKDRYMLMASLRHEGSSKFGKNYQWGQFPAVSLGWRINKESFMQNVRAVNDLKLRAGYGITGTIPNDPYRSLILSDYGARFLSNGRWIQQIAPGSNPNPDLRWEKKLEWNFGVDFALFNNRVSGSIDAYQRDTKDMLYNFAVPVPPYLFNSILWNSGHMRNRGLEVLVNVVPVRSKKFEWNTNFTFSANKNKLIAITGPASSGTIDYITAGGTGEPIQEATHRNYVGQPVGSFYGYKSIDIAPDSTWIIEGEDGKPKSMRNSTPSDKKILGNGIPKYIVGWNNSFQMGNWDLNINLRGAFGYQILNMQKMYYANPKINQYNMLQSAFDPVYGKTPIYADLAYVSYYIEQGDHIKIDNVSLGYALPIKNSKVIRNARVYVAGLNLLTITGYTGIDPEVNRVGLSPGIDERDKYPTTRSFTVGANITF